MARAETACVEVECNITQLLAGSDASYIPRLSI